MKATVIAYTDAFDLREATDNYRQPVIVTSMPISVYHGKEMVGLSKSGLDLLAQSPAHWQAARSPDAPPPKAKQGQLEGALAHTATLEPALFDSLYSVGPELNRNTREWKSFVASLRPGVTAIQPDQSETAWRQARSLSEIPDFARLLQHPNSLVEASCFWIDAATGVLCRCRPDLAARVGQNEDVAVLVDVKTYGRATASAFKRQSARMRYFVQDAFYSDGWSAATGLEVGGFIFAAVEADYPFGAALFAHDGDAQELGRREYRAGLERYAACVASNEWPGYPADVQVIDLPAWAFNVEE